MGEAAPFVKHSLDSESDKQIAAAGLPVEIAKAGELSVAAVQALQSAALAGDPVAIGAAQDAIAQTVGALVDLGKDLSRVVAFGTEQAAKAK